MHSERSTPRLRLPVSGLEQYLIDPKGGIWKQRGKRSGRDQPLVGTSFAECMLQIGTKFTSYQIAPWPVIPGVWVMLPVSQLPDEVPYTAHIPIRDFFTAFCTGRESESLPGWPKWDDQFSEAASQLSNDQSRNWFTISNIGTNDWVDTSLSTPVALWGPLALLAVKLKVDVCYPRSRRYPPIL